MPGIHDVEQLRDGAERLAVLDVARALSVVAVTLGARGPAEGRILSAGRLLGVAVAQLERLEVVPPRTGAERLRLRVARRRLDAALGEVTDALEEETRDAS